MSKAFYRKYRSKNLSEVIGQEHITSALDKALKSQSISHAYLFTGPRGVGKTSVARILAHEINGLPYLDDESTHIDIIEIDAASNRRIDEIRDLKEKVHITPTSAKYKVYIIDEVHMLTKEAFNALLKTLEEPPAHVVFILATTEAHKLPETIISRTQRYTFKPVESTAVTEHLAGIAKKEGIVVDKEALEIIATHGQGSFRDSISLLDQLRHSSERITPVVVEHALGVAPDRLIGEVITAITNKDITLLKTVLVEVQSQGIDIIRFAQQLSSALRSLVVNGIESPTNAKLALLDALARVGAHPNPSIALDIALYGQLVDDTPAAAATPIAKPPKKTTKPPVSNEPEIEQPPTDELQDAPMPVFEPEQIQDEEEELPPLEDTATDNMPEWDNILNAVKKKHSTLYGVVRMSNPSIDENTISLSFVFPFHSRRIAEDKNRRVLEDIIHQTTGRKFKVVAVTNKNVPKSSQLPVKSQKKPEPEPLESVSNIFGTVEIVES